jgi:hypothetical protein
MGDSCQGLLDAREHYLGQVLLVLAVLPLKDNLRLQVQKNYRTKELLLHDTRRHPGICVVAINYWKLFFVDFIERTRVLAVTDYHRFEFEISVRVATFRRDDELVKLPH